MAGRPRDESLTARIIDATLAALAEHGYAGTTVEGVARRAGVSRPTVYKRWPLLADLLLDATLAARSRAPAYVTGEMAAPDTGTLRGDLRELARQGTAILDVLADAGLLEGLVADAIRHPHVGDRLRDELLAPDEEAVGAIVDRAVERGELATGGDLAVRLPQVLLSYALLRRLLLDDPPTPADFDALVDLLCDGALPR